MNQITETEEKKTTSEGVNSEMEKSLDMLKSKVQELSSSLMDKATELEELHTVASEQETAHEAVVNSLKAEVESLKSALEVATKAAEEAVSELTQIRDDALLEKRVTELKDANLFRSNEEARIKQVEKIKSMNDEEFATYKDDLSDIRNQALGTPAVVVETEVKNEEVIAAAELISEKAPVATQDKIRQLLAKVAGETVTIETPKAVKEEIQEEQSSESSKESASCMVDHSTLASAFNSMLKIEL